jgi:ubiquinone/menaquinone biosynthesis C-methylase UbiE
MKQTGLVTEQFGNTAQAYLTSTVHASGADLEAIRQAVARYRQPKVLDLGCGAGHVSFAAAPVALAVTAYDLSEKMLEVVAASAAQRGLSNIVTVPGRAESLPFADASFDVVATRFSAHHWGDVPAAMREMRRVLRPGGIVLVIDIVAPENPLHDTVLQTLELLRDASHVRDYRVSEWQTMFDQAGFAHACESTWRLRMAFDEWIARMRTPSERVAAIRSVLDGAAEEARAHFSVEADHSFWIDAALFEARKR